jgi:hypothetical protein
MEWCTLWVRCVIRIRASGRCRVGFSTAGRWGHTFWPDDISLFDSKRIDADRLLDPAQVTDTYLLALAAAHRGQLPTFDRHLVANAVFDGSAALI